MFFLWQTTRQGSSQERMQISLTSELEQVRQVWRRPHTGLGDRTVLDESLPASVFTKARKAKGGSPTILWLRLRLLLVCPLLEVLDFGIPSVFPIF